MEPICEFENQEALEACLSWWKAKLFLNDWIISVRIVPMKDFEITDSVGENLMVFDNKECVIHLLAPEDYPEDSVVRYCQEKVLVHELLHCLYNFLHSENTYEGKYVDVLDHQRLDAMAKSLIMTKYDIDLEWFKNVKSTVENTTE